MPGDASHLRVRLRSTPCRPPPRAYRPPVPRRRAVWYTRVTSCGRTEERAAWQYIATWSTTYRSRIAEARRRFGYFTIHTTDREATAKEIVDAYREKDEDEKQCMGLKQFLGARRPRVHSQEALEGKYFVLLVALVLTKWLRERLGAYMSAHHLTLRRCLMKMSDVRMYVADDEVRLEKAITSEQRELLAPCGGDAEGLEERERASIIASRASRGGSGA